MENNKYLLPIKVITSMLIITELVLQSSSQSTKSTVFLSPKFELEPGSVIDRFFYGIDFPRGHLGVMGFNAEIVDESGNSVPLSEAYIHHWIVAPFRWSPAQGTANGSNNFVPVPGRCLATNLTSYFGVGSETRRTLLRLPEPYAFKTGRFDDEYWRLNVHVIDTRGVADRLGCTECRCNLYNVTVDEFGQDLSPDYKGGLSCCYDNTRCRLSGKGSGSVGGKRGLFLRYTVTWQDWSESLLPVKAFTLDITDEYYGKPALDGTRRHFCHVEYEVKKSCNASNRCVDTRRNKMSVPISGYVVHAVAHQHTGGLGSSLSREDGKVLCKSNPIYGRGIEPGNEAGYVVGMTACYPKFGSVEIRKGEALMFESRYDSRRGHTGVMGLFVVIVADRLPNYHAVSVSSRIGTTSVN